MPPMDSARSLTASSSVPLNRVETLIRLSGTSTTVSGAVRSADATTVRTHYWMGCSREPIKVQLLQKDAFPQELGAVEAGHNPRPATSIAKN